ncbi:MAG TPA: SMP-30/gluconolactonase/LRE family protein [Bdellovibrionales bacterium]|nr:SMP-30/gluconolactonase/LRE family protein [Bdellovibrionales bacterium]
MNNQAPSRLKNVFFKVVLPLIVLSPIFGYFTFGLVETGAFRPISPRFDGTCKEAGPIKGAEDIERLGSGLLIAAADNRPERPGDKTESGALYKLGADGSGLARITDELPFEFHPHGLGVYESGGTAWLWAINHRSTGSTIEKFRFDGSVAAHVKTYQDPLIANANDVAAVDEERFYFTRDHESTTHWQKRMSDYVRYGTGMIVSFDGSSFKARFKGLAFANGILVTGGGKRVLAAEMLRQRVWILDVLDNGELKPATALKLPSSPDNLSFDDEGNIWVGAHPNLLALRKHALSHTAPGPSEVLKIANWESGRPEFTSVFMDDGTRISGVSVAQKSGKNLVLGTIYDDVILVCTMN